MHKFSDSEFLNVLAFTLDHAAGLTIVLVVLVV